MKPNHSILLTVDVEDWFQVENFKKYIPFSSWPICELRVERNTHKLLDLFDSTELKANSSRLTVDNQMKTDFEQSAMSYELGHDSRPKATFFVLGWIAKKVPHLVREIYDRGHEVASHGFYHKVGNKQSSQEIRLDLSDSKKLLEDIIGAGVYGYRTPNFAINDDILKIIEEVGYQYDSSYNSFAMHGRYGRLNLSRTEKYGIAAKITNAFWELPISNLRLMKHIIPWGGGAYFRLIPAKLFGLGVQSILGRQNAYLFYLHPWELDPQQPRVSEVSLFTRFRHYSNLHRTESNLLSFIESFKQPCFITCYRYLKMVKNKAVNGLGGN